MAIYSPPTFIAQQAAIAQRQAVLYTKQACLLDLRLQLVQAAAPVFAAANLTIPAELTEGTLAADRQAALASAQAQYAQAATFYQTVAGAPAASPEQIGDACVGRLFALYGLSQSQRAAGKPDLADQSLSDASAAKTEALNRNVLLPPLPSALSASANASSIVP